MLSTVHSSTIIPTVIPSSRPNLSSSHTARSKVKTSDHGTSLHVSEVPSTSLPLSDEKGSGKGSGKGSPSSSSCRNMLLSSQSSLSPYPYPSNTRSKSPGKAHTQAQAHQLAYTAERGDAHERSYHLQERINQSLHGSSVHTDLPSLSEDSMVSTREPSVVGPYTVNYDIEKIDEIYEYTKMKVHILYPLLYMLIYPLHPYIP